MKKLLLLLFLLLIPLANAQATLKPGSTTFSVASITLTGAGIELQAGFNTTQTSYLNVYWNSYYIGSSNTTIGATCYLNCIPETQDCSSAQQCNYTGYPGPAICTIVNPTYKFTEINNITCKFYNPKYPAVEYKPYPYRTFYPINFEVYYPSVTTTVGKETKLQISVRNIGLFTDKYNVSASTNKPNIIAIDSSTLKTAIGPLTGNSYGSTPQTDSAYVKLVVLASQDAEICFTVNSTTDPSVNPFSKCIPIKSSYASLSDFNFLGIIWIMLISSALILINKTF
jgi:hypothetical protein